MEKRKSAMFRAFSRKSKFSFLNFAALGAFIVLLILNNYLTRGLISDVEGRAKVIDGDSLVVNGREVRLQGIDAPEGRQMCRRNNREWACGRESRNVLRRLIGSKTVSCQALDVDKHDRLLALCRVDGVELNREMVALGFALSYGRYRDDERAAKAARRGMWTGEFERPRDWRGKRNIGR